MYSCEGYTLHNSKKYNSHCSSHKLHSPELWSAQPTQMFLVTLGFDLFSNTKVQLRTRSLSRIK